MNGVHDMGGMHGHGSVVAEGEDEPHFHAEWEARVRAIAGLAGSAGLFNIDEFRHAIEQMDPRDYLQASYYERWLTAVETLAREKNARPAGEPPPETRQNAPRFRPGDRVRARNLHPRHHTRLPRYIRGKRGTVVSVNGPFLLPDTNSEGTGRDWQYVYPVRFVASELWGENGAEKDSVCVDLWDAYLEEDQ